MEDYRKRELRSIALNEVQLRGQSAGWVLIQQRYWRYELTDEEARDVADLVWGAKIVLPED